MVAVLIDRLECFQRGPYQCTENAKMLSCLREALQWTKNRADARSQRGTLARRAAG